MPIEFYSCNHQHLASKQSLLCVKVKWPILRYKRSSPSSSAKAASERLGSSRSGTSRLRDFHFIKFRPAGIPVWLNASRERLLRAPRPLRLRLRCQKKIRCRSASGCVAALHNPRLTDAVIFGGISRIALWVVFSNISAIPSILALIIKSAFGFEQAAGGAVGTAILMGFKRGIFAKIGEVDILGE